MAGVVPFAVGHGEVLSLIKIKEIYFKVIRNDMIRL